MSREIDPRVKAFESYLEKQITAQQQRPYSEREDIERRIQIYEDVRSCYRKMLEADSLLPDRKWYENPITELELSVRAGSCLERVGIENIGQLLEYTDEDLLKIRSFGRTSLIEVQRKLESLGLSIQKGPQFNNPIFPKDKK